MIIPETRDDLGLGGMHYLVNVSCIAVDVIRNTMRM